MKRAAEYQIRKDKHPLLFQLLILYIFFLPLRSIEIPGVFVGFSINPARLFALLAILVLFANICLDTKYYNKILKSDIYKNKYLKLLVLYFIFATWLYYVYLVFDKIVLFGNKDFFFRNWKGRPIGQFLSFISYGFIPFLLTQAYAKDNLKQRIIEKTIIFTTLFLVYYGIIQQISFILSLPVTGRDLYEGKVAAESIPSISRGLLRFYSLGGEPRHFGGFIIGALFFYKYFTLGRKSRSSKINLFFMITSLFLTLSATVFIIAICSLIAIMLDSICNRRLKYISNFMLILLFILIVLFSTGLFSTVTYKARQYYESYTYYLEKPHIDVPYMVKVQSTRFSIIQYFKRLHELNLVNVIFGFGYGNFSTGISKILKEDYDRDIVEDGQIPDASFYMYRIIVECGFFGTFLYMMLYFYTLKLNSKLLRFCIDINDKNAFKRNLYLRFSFITFFISSALSLSFYYFIIMGIIIGKLNYIEMSKSKKIMPIFESR